MRIGYIRVSTEEQDEDRQKMLLEPYNLAIVYQEKVSGKDMERKELQNLLTLISRNKEAGETDTVYVTEISRLARSTSDLYKIIERFEANNVNLVSVTEPAINTTTPMGKALFGILAVMSEFERSLIRQRQRDGIRAKKAQGKHLGRPYKDYDAESFDWLYGQYQKRLITVTEMAKKLGVSRATVYRIIEKRKGNQQ